jgi:hypothetical protein
MNNMNPLYQELIVRRQAAELEAELNRIRLLNEAETAAPSQSGWAAHQIAHFAEWMIVTGESLRERYDHAAMHECGPHTQALAH